MQYKYSIATSIEAKIVCKQAFKEIIYTPGKERACLLWLSMRLPFGDIYAYYKQRSLSYDPSEGVLALRDRRITYRIRFTNRISVSCLRSSLTSMLVFKRYYLHLDSYELCQT